MFLGISPRVLPQLLVPSVYLTRMVVGKLSGSANAILLTVRSEVGLQTGIGFGGHIWLPAVV
jgi:hypothetical protein